MGGGDGTNNMKRGVSGLVGVNVIHVYIQERGTGQWNKTGSCIDSAGILGKNRAHLGK